MKPKYRVLISTRGTLGKLGARYVSDSYNEWSNNYSKANYDIKYLNNTRTIQGNQVNYFIPISE